MTGDDWLVDDGCFLLDAWLMIDDDWWKTNDWLIGFYLFIDDAWLVINDYWLVTND
jgi:hypothetical protein